MLLLQRLTADCLQPQAAEAGSVMPLQEDAPTPMETEAAPEAQPISGIQEPMREQAVAAPVAAPSTGPSQAGASGQEVAEPEVNLPQLA